MARTEIIAEPGTQQIEISREFDAPVALVYRAYTDPTLLAQWLGPRRQTMTVDRHELRDGGIWRYVHRDPEGNEFGFHGVFHGTPSPENMVRTFEYEGFPGHVSLETATFEDLGDGQGRTRVHINSVFQSAADRDGMVASGMESGLNEGMERLDELLARLQAESGNAAS